ncbi:MAG TPA: DUF2695 domain-containing protein [Planosporangium sp.]|jgi:hypothetical protein|nr:DUF2695 domain-containing protein [Planosporangium sp.]
MGSSPDKARRKQLRDAYENAERAARTSLLPLRRDQLAALVEFVDARVVEGCDHTTRHGEQWAREHGIEWEALSEGLEEFGGFCDCEIVMNCDPDQVFD